jgi:predicted DNA-binding transcriptional regulator AlpA
MTVVTTSPDRAQGRTERPLLRGWKEIAAYLGASQRTAQRYAAEFDLPVTRAGGHGAVTAFPAEVDAWVARTRPPAPPVAADPEVPTTGAPPAATDPTSAAEPPVLSTAVLPSPLDKPSAGGRHRLATRVWLGGALVTLGVVTAAWLGRPVRPQGSAPPTEVVLAVRVPPAPAVELVVATGRTGVVEVGGVSYVLRPEWRDNRLHVTVYEGEAAPPAGVAPAASMELTREDSGTRSVQVKLGSAWLELAWRDVPAWRVPAP